MLRCSSVEVRDYLKINVTLHHCKGRHVTNVKWHERMYSSECADVPDLLKSVTHRSRHGDMSKICSSNLNQYGRNDVKLLENRIMSGKLKL